MPQRFSGYDRKANDHYATPAWVTRALLPFIDLPRGASVLESAPGSGDMAVVLEAAGFDVIRADWDFLEHGCNGHRVAGIITNPPYGLGGRTAHEFVRTALQALRILAPYAMVAMLLKVDFDSGVTRADVFDVPTFARKVVLRDRIKWFEPATAQPSDNHAWFIWERDFADRPTIRYASDDRRPVKRQRRLTVGGALDSSRFSKSEAF